MADKELGGIGSRIDRRTALKAAAAAGVGAAAMAGPQVGRLGATPAYAAMCSQPWVDQGATCKNTSCDCDNAAGEKIINYKSFSVGGASSAGGCSDSASVTLPVPPPGFAQCRIRVEVWENGQVACVNQSGNLLATAFTVGSTGGSVPMPEVVCGSFANNSGIFTRLSVECNADTTVPCD